ncbi:transcription factor Adf-1-like [Homalodisca vitripennis]|uniref:transcription factor Adf-1-like n=1 Tax=Homalodisca vitripennis TaxID=197043 RepID=UPI001EEC96C4|nr:transcription factor Adf-1-like [Homalodisca vitripennis]
MIEDELLIELVKAHPFLYDPNDPDYHDNRRRERTWYEISENLESFTAADCRRRWIQLRDSYRKTLQKKIRTPGEGSKRPWKYETIMKFILPHMIERKRLPNPDHESDESVDSASQQQILEDGVLLVEESLEESQDVKYQPEVPLHDDTRTPRLKVDLSRDRSRSPVEGSKAKNSTKPAKRNSLSTILQRYVHSKTNRRDESDLVDDDALSSFFKAMEKTVRNFSAPMQIEVKGKIANLVNEYELKDYNTKDKTPSTSTPSHPTQ